VGARAPQIRPERPKSPGNVTSIILESHLLRFDAIKQCSHTNGSATISEAPSRLRHQARPAGQRLADHTTHVYFHADNPMIG
jgi:hypothetical protein